MPNPLLSDRTVDFLLYEVLDVTTLTRLPAFEAHSRDTFDPYLDACRKLAREKLFPAYKALDESPPRLESGRVRVHPLLRELYPKMVELGLLTATRPEAVGGQQLPIVVANLAASYLMAGNLSAYGYAGLTTSAARLIESFGSEALRDSFMTKMYGGEWTGTMALTEPQAGSSLSDVKTTATPTEGGHHSIRGSKIFISGGDQDFTENIVNLTLARIQGAPPGVKGISLFAIPNRRFERGSLVPNDVEVAGVIHKIGWKGIPSIAQNYGERGDCHGYLVGQPHRGLAYMFQMMNEARLMVGMNGVATASVAYFESLEYAKTRPQGRPIANKNPEAPQVPIIVHADVRRMLLRQKAIVEGGLSLVAWASREADLAEHSPAESERKEHALLLDLLTPVVKSFPAERGFESNALAVQIHGGYGYSSEYLPEAFLRDQKLNSLHEGTTGIQSMDLLGRKVAQDGGRALELLSREVRFAVSRAREAGLPATLTEPVETALRSVLDLTEHLLGLGSPDRTLLHSVDYLDLFGTFVVGFLWLRNATVANEALRRGTSETAFYEGKLAAAEYFIRTELRRVETLAALCREGEDSYVRLDENAF
ncbi:MAG TPA: acyl-CoA dehydrogenase [Polyangiaceae bacterium]|nr:acyl-CoA dehydrogenase [Polyangiaceae bacterium]